MIREQALGLGAIVAAVLSIGGALALVQAQQSPGTGPVPATPAGQFGSTPQKSGGMGKAGTGAGFPGTPGMLGPMAMAFDDDPEMNELAQSEAVLANDSAEILARFTEAENAAERKKISAELRETLAKQFDVQRQRRELELARVEERVRKLREQIKKRDDARETIIERRLDQLINDAEGLGWSPPASSSARGRSKSPGTGHGVGRGPSSSNFPRQ
jgi:hypothetical protein